MQSFDFTKKDDTRMTVFPIHHQDLWQMYKKHVASFWTPEEIDFSHDEKDWNSLSSDEQYFITNILAFFAVSDSIVLENCMTKFMNEITLPEARSFYSFQIAMETIHTETYSLLVDTYIKDTKLKNKIFNHCSEFQCIKKKNDWALKWMTSDSSLAQRLVAFAIIEGVFFSGAFCSIFWLKKRNLLHGLTFSNELISRDEGLHTTFATLLYHKMEPLAQEIIFSIMKEAIEIEMEFITDILPCNLIGMNQDYMKEYIKFVADHLLVDLGCEKLYNAKNPFDFMEMISLTGKTNFFEKRVGEYQKSRVMTAVAADNFKFTINEDF